MFQPLRFRVSVLLLVSKNLELAAVWLLGFVGLRGGYGFIGLSLRMSVGELDCRLQRANVKFIRRGSQITGELNGQSCHTRFHSDCSLELCWLRAVVHGFVSFFLTVKGYWNHVLSPCIRPCLQALYPNPSVRNASRLGARFLAQHIKSVRF